MRGAVVAQRLQLGQHRRQPHLLRRGKVLRFQPGLQRRQAGGDVGHLRSSRLTIGHPGLRRGQLALLLGQRPQPLFQAGIFVTQFGLPRRQALQAGFVGPPLIALGLAFGLEIGQQLFTMRFVQGLLAKGTGGLPGLLQELDLLLQLIHLGAQLLALRLERRRLLGQCGQLLPQRLPPRLLRFQLRQRRLRLGQWRPLRFTCRHTSPQGGHLRLRHPLLGHQFAPRRGDRRLPLPPLLGEWPLRGQPGVPVFDCLPRRRQGGVAGLDLLPLAQRLLVGGYLRFRGAQLLGDLRQLPFALGQPPLQLLQLLLLMEEGLPLHLQVLLLRLGRAQLLAPLDRGRFGLL